MQESRGSGPFWEIYTLNIAIFMLIPHNLYVNGGLSCQFSILKIVANNKTCFAEGFFWITPFGSSTTTQPNHFTGKTLRFKGLQVSLKHFGMIGDDTVDTVNVFKSASLSLCCFHKQTRTVVFQFLHPHTHSYSVL